MRLPEIMGQEQEQIIRYLTPYHLAAQLHLFPISPALQAPTRQARPPQALGQADNPTHGAGRVEPMERPSMTS